MHRTRRVLFAVVAACVALAILPTAAFAISRDLVIARGKVWVNHVQSKTKKATVYGVPYSQSKWAYENGSIVTTKNASSLGYRTDCSGFASMCLNLRDSAGHPYSECTAGFGAKGSKKYHQITKAQLVAGDMVLASGVWGAPGPHAIIFAGWVDAKQTQFWAMEQTSSSSHNGTILHPRSWKDAVARKFRPYRYVGLEDPYSDVEESVSGVDAYRSAAAACASAFPGSKTRVPAIVVLGAGDPGMQVTAASLAGALGGPVLLTYSTSLPASTTAEIKRLKPKRVIVLGSTSIVATAVVTKLRSLGCKATRIVGLNRYEVSAAALAKNVSEASASGHPVNTAYLANGASISDALAASPILGKTGRPLLFVNKGGMHGYTARALKASGIKQVIVLGSTAAISTAQVRTLKKAGYHVTRVAGTSAYKTSLAVAGHAISLKVGFTWKSLGVASPAACTDALAWALANGRAGRVYVLTPSKALDATVRKLIVKHHSEIGKARIFGGPAAVSDAARKSLAKALRSGK
jgi:putative cell wall-binding protein